MRKGIDYSIESVLREFVSKSVSITDAVTKMGYHPKSGSVNKNVSALIKKYNIDVSHFKYRTWHKSKEALEKVIEQSLSYSEVLRKLGIKDKGSNYETLKKYILKFDIDTSHFDKLAASYNTKKSRGSFAGIPLVEIISGRHRFRCPTLKRKLLAAGIKEHRCERCGIVEWNGEEIVIELDHIDGDNTNNLLENLRMLCPNCHSQTPTYKGKKRQ